MPAICYFVRDWRWRHGYTPRKHIGYVLCCTWDIAQQFWLEYKSIVICLSRPLLLIFKSDWYFESCATTPPSPAAQSPFPPFHPHYQVVLVVVSMVMLMLLLLVVVVVVVVVVMVVAVVLMNKKSLIKIMTIFKKSLKTLQ